MKGCGGVVYLPGHPADCTGRPESVGTYTYEGYGVIREFDMTMCPVCLWRDHGAHMVSEAPRREPLTREQVRGLQAAEKVKREAVFEAARARFAAGRP